MNKIVIKDHIREVPLDHFNKKKDSIHVFAREVYQKGNEKADIFVYLQGGPGFASPRSAESLPAFKVLLSKYRLVLLDQRGTGKSNKIGPETCLSFSKDEDLAKYFTYFRADQIVCDVEYLREKVFKAKKIFLIAQSYGGFISFTYLSFFPQSIAGVIVFGGIPPLLENSVENIYDVLTNNIIKRNKEYYKKFPKDKTKIKKILAQLKNKPYQLPDGGNLTAERFLDMGMILGATGGINSLHNLLDDPFVNAKEKAISYFFARTSADRTSFETNPIYAVLHESIYCNAIASNWAAAKNLYSKKEFSLNSPNTFFYGETIRPSMFKDYAMLRPYKKAAEIIAKKADWGLLYHLDQLTKNTVPIEALVYQTDYYVDPTFSVNTSKVIPKLNITIDPKLQHDSIRTKGPEIVANALKKLLKRI